MNNKVREILGLHKVKGDLGIEIEMESNGPFPDDSPEGWEQEEDGSLRGWSTEFISNGPVEYRNVDSHLEELKSFLKKEHVKINDSFRAGVHVHVNCQELTLEQIVNVSCVYYCLETVLTRFCGSAREGNFFCLRLSDAEAPLFYLLDALLHKDITYLNTENLRYAALNFQALFKHGSLEFRAMGTQPDLSKIADWAKILFRIKEYASNLTNRQQIPSEISYQGPSMWFEQVVGKEYFDMLKYNKMDKDILQSMRNIQELLYYKDDVGD